MTSTMMIKSKTSKTPGTALEDVWNYIDIEKAYEARNNKKLFLGYEKIYLEIESWIRAQNNCDENFPLLLVFEDQIDQILFFSKFLEYHQSISDIKGPEFYIPIMTSLGGKYQQTNYILYWIMNKLRELFNIKQRVPMNENELRKYFHYWLQLASDKLKQSVVLSNNAILYIESVEKLRESDGVHFMGSAKGGNTQSSLLKYWMPKTFPERIK